MTDDRERRCLQCGEPLPPGRLVFCRPSCRAKYEHQHYQPTLFPEPLDFDAAWPEDERVRPRANRRRER
ncbi:MAG TPA: hypothetical protein VFB89_13120 [Gemmatimonadales bacterium]|nr:hypothetical protein [Gemmatimonadales bacterium]